MDAFDTIASASLRRAPGATSSQKSTSRRAPEPSGPWLGSHVSVRSMAITVRGPDPMATRASEVSRRVDDFQDVRRLINELSSLRATLPITRVMAACFRDAFEFVGALPLGIPSPTIWTDGEAEIGIEWISEARHAIVTVEGLGILGYALLIGEKFQPGSQIEAPAASIPTDLASYLKAM